MSPDGNEELLTRDVQEALTSLQDLASHPRLRCLLYGNKVLQHYGRTENNRGETSTVFGKISLIYEQVLRDDPEGKGINENFLSSQLDPQASSDQKTTQIPMQTSNDVLPRDGTHEMDLSIPDAINTGAALVLILATGSSNKPVDYDNIGYGCNLPVSRRRLQRDFNRAILETKIGFFTTVTRDMMTRDNLNATITRKVWKSGVVHPESKQVLSYIRRGPQMPFETIDVNQLHKDTIEFGQSAAGVILTQIAR